MFVTSLSGWVVQHKNLGEKLSSSFCDLTLAALSPWRHELNNIFASISLQKNGGEKDRDGKLRNFFSLSIFSRSKALTPLEQVVVAGGREKVGQGRSDFRPRPPRGFVGWPS